MRAPRRPSRHAGVVDRRTLTGCTATPPLCRQRQPGTFPICKSAEVVAELGYYNSSCSEGDTNECCEDYADVAVESPLEPLPENVCGIGCGGSDDDDCAGGLTIPGCSCNLWENTTSARGGRAATDAGARCVIRTGHDFLEFLRLGNDAYAPRSVEQICASRESLFGACAREG